MLWFLIALGVVSYVNIGGLTKKYLDEKKGTSWYCDGEGEYILGAFWPFYWLILISVLFGKIMLLPQKVPKLYKGRREKRLAKKAAEEAKLLEAHQIDPLQEEWNELRRQVASKERELDALKLKRDEVEVQLEGNYREQARI